MNVEPYANNIVNRLKQLNIKPDDPMYSKEVWKIVCEEVENMIKFLFKNYPSVIRISSVSGLTTPPGGGPVNAIPQASSINGTIENNG